MFFGILEFLCCHLMAFAFAIANGECEKDDVFVLDFRSNICGIVRLKTPHSLKEVALSTLDTDWNLFF